MIDETNSIIIENDHIYSQRVIKETLSINHSFIRDIVDYPTSIPNIAEDTTAIISKDSYFIAKSIRSINLKTFWKLVEDVNETYITPSYDDNAESAYYEKEYEIPSSISMYFVTQFGRTNFSPMQYYALWKVNGEYYPAAFPNIYNDGTVCLGAAPTQSLPQSYLESFNSTYEAFLNNTWNTDLYSNRCKYIRFKEDIYNDNSWNQIWLETNAFTSSTTIISTDAVRIIGNGLSS